MNRFAVLCLSVLILGPLTACAGEDMGPIKVEIVKTNTGYQLLRGGKPYVIKGAGLNLMEGDLNSFAAHGGNSIRNWNTKHAAELLDKAHELGVSVALCLWIGHERHGFDYNDEAAVAEQLEWAREEVLKYKDHPALLAWIIGNELNFDYTNSKVYDAVNDISKMIHEVDGNHPTTTTVAGFFEDVLVDIQERAPDLDFYSFQVYGMLGLLPEFLPPEGFDKPIMITEWGSIGHWEVEKTEWDAPIELTSSRKAGIYRGGKMLIEAAGDQIIGDYAFLWGWKQERTPTWFGLFTEKGERTESVDEMYVQWNGAFPEDRAPSMHAIRLDGKTANQNVRLVAGQTYEASVSVDDVLDDKLSYRWELKPESTADEVGGDYEESIASLDGAIVGGQTYKVTIKAPDKPGAYRLFAYAYDEKRNAAHANVPFYVDAQ